MGKRISVLKVKCIVHVSGTVHFLYFLFVHIDPSFTFNIKNIKNIGPIAVGLGNLAYGMLIEAMSK